MLADPFENIQRRFRDAPLFPEVDEEVQQFNLRRRLMPPTHLVTSMKYATRRSAESNQKSAFAASRPAEPGAAAAPRDAAAPATPVAVPPVQVTHTDVANPRKKADRTPWGMAARVLTEASEAPTIPPPLPLPPPLVRPAAVHTFMENRDAFASEVDLGTPTTAARGERLEPRCEDSEKSAVQGTESSRRWQQPPPRRHSTERSRHSLDTMKVQRRFVSPASYSKSLSGGTRAVPARGGGDHYDADFSDTSSATSMERGPFDGFVGDTEAAQVGEHGARPHRRPDLEGSRPSGGSFYSNAIDNLDELAILEHAKAAVAQYYNSLSPAGEAEAANVSPAPTRSEESRDITGLVSTPPEQLREQQQQPLGRGEVCATEGSRIASGPVRDAFARGSGYWDSLLRSSGLDPSSVDASCGEPAPVSQVLSPRGRMRGYSPSPVSSSIHQSSQLHTSRSRDHLWSLETDAAPLLESKRRLEVKLDEMERKTEDVVRLMNAHSSSQGRVLGLSVPIQPFEPNILSNAGSRPQEGKLGGKLAVPSLAFDGRNLREWAESNAPDFTRASSSILQSVPRSGRFPTPPNTTFIPAAAAESDRHRRQGSPSVTNDYSVALHRPSSPAATSPLTQSRMDSAGTTDRLVLSTGQRPKKKASPPSAVTNFAEVTPRPQPASSPQPPPPQRGILKSSTSPQLPGTSGGSGGPNESILSVKGKNNKAAKSSTTVSSKGDVSPRPARVVTIIDNGEEIPMGRQKSKSKSAASV